MRIPGYPSNREVDENAMETTAKAGRCMSRMRPSRETYLHRESIIPLGVGYAIWADGLFSVCRKGRLVWLVFLREGRFSFALRLKKPLSLIHLIAFRSGNAWPN